MISRTQIMMQEMKLTRTQKYENLIFVVTNIAAPVAFRNCAAFTKRL